MLRHIRLIVGMGLGCWLAGCSASQEELAWQVARDSSSPSDYANYLRQYPSGAHVEEARWEAVRKNGTLLSYVEFLRANPSSPRKGELEDLILAAADKPLTVSDSYAYLSYVRSFKNPSKKLVERAEKIRTSLEGLEWEAARSKGELMPLVFFVRKYPSSAHAAEARKTILEKRFESTKKFADPDGYRAFLAFYGSGPEAEEVKTLLSKSEPEGPAGGSVSDLEVDHKSVIPKLAAKDPHIGRMACSLVLADKIQKGGSASQLDEWREQMNQAEQTPEALPASCQGFPGVTLNFQAPGAGAAIKTLLRGREDFTQILERAKAMEQRVALLDRSTKAADAMAQQLESDELSEGVLGGGALGGIDLGLSEKGSVTALRAKERLSSLHGAAAQNLKTAVSLVKGEGNRNSAVQFYLVALLKMEP